MLSAGDLPLLEHLPQPIREMADLPGLADGTGIVFQDYSNAELKQARNQASTNAVAEIERRFLKGLLASAGGQVGLAAQRSGMNRTYLYRLLAKYGLTTKA